MVSILLLLATMINYMDRQVLANMSVRIKDQLQLSATEYGNIEWAFGTAFASPFFLLALVPSMLKKLPKSGGWMNSIKVVMQQPH